MRRAARARIAKPKATRVDNAEVAPENASGIVTFHRPDADLPALHQKLADVQSSPPCSADRTGTRYLRLSPHFYNTAANWIAFWEMPDSWHTCHGFFTSFAKHLL